MPASSGRAVSASRKAVPKPARPAPAAARSGARSSTREQTHRLHDPGVDLRLGQSSVERVEDRRTHAEVVLGEAEGEEGRLDLLVLRRRGQDVVGLLRRLGHGHVDDHGEVELAHRPAELLRAGQGVGGVGALDDHGPGALGMVAEHPVGDLVARDHPGDDAPAGDGITGLPACCPVGEQGCHGGVRRHAARHAVAADEEPQQPLQVGDQRGVGRHLHPEVLVDGDAAGSGEPARRTPDEILRHPAPQRVLPDGNPLQRRQHHLGPDGVLGEPPRGSQVLLDEDGSECGDAERVRAGAHLQEVVGQVGGLGAPGVDHHHRPTRVGGDLLQHPPRLVEAVAVPRVLAEEHGDLRLVELAVGVGAEQVALHPRLARLLLGQRVGPPGDAERLAGRCPVGAAQVVALAAAAVVQDPVAAVLVDDPLEPGGDLGDRRVPVDLLVAAVLGAAQR